MKVKETLEKVWKNGKISSETVYCVADIVRIKNDLSHLIFSYSFNDSPLNGQLTDSLDMAIFDSLLKSKIKLSINEKITKIIEWNRYDIAKKQIFNEKLDWVNMFCFHLKLVF